jgi:hypothetical protein
MEITNVIIDVSLGVQLSIKWNYVIDMCSQLINSSILKNLCQAKQEKHMNKKTIKINLVQHLWLAHYQERIDQVLLLCNEYLWKQFYHKKKILKNESMEDMK